MTAPRPHAASDAGALLSRIPGARAWWASRSPLAQASLAADTVGNLRLINVDLNSACFNSDVRGARVMAVGTSAIVLADTALAGRLTSAEYGAVAQAFDTLVHPFITQNLLEPADIDGNKRIAIVFTSAVNRQLASIVVPTAAFRARDLLPSGGGADACPTSNVAELLYAAVPDPAGEFGAVRAKADLLKDFPGALAHEYQHLINASRRLYVSDATGFEESWLDEGLSQIAEEIVFHAAASRASRQNLAAVDLNVTPETAAAFDRFRRGTVLLYRDFLANGAQTSPLSAIDSRERRGAAWSLLRYLADRREWFDFITWNALAGSSRSGMANLQAVFGAQVRAQMRDWAVSLLTDDLFATWTEFQQPSWNHRSIFAASALPYPLLVTTLTASGSRTVTVAPASAAYLSFTVPANGSSSVAWSGPASATVSPTLQWALVRIR